MSTELRFSSSELRVRRPTEEDVTEIREIAKHHDFPLVEKFEAAALVENSRIHAFGVLRTFLEAILYCDGSKKEKTLSVDMLISQAIEDSIQLGHDSIVVFAQEPKFAKLLKDRYKFREMQGTPLILELGSVEKSDE